MTCWNPTNEPRAVQSLAEPSEMRRSRAQLSPVVKKSKVEAQGRAG